MIGNTVKLQLCVYKHVRVYVLLCVHPTGSAHVCVNSIQNFSFRYKLSRRKTQQPLATASVPTETDPSPPPPEDLHRWLHVYSGTKLFYQDKGLSR